MGKRKDFGKLLASYYYPMASFAVLSLISFLINPDVIPGRMGMIVTLYLISANVYNSVEGPSSRGFSNIELWMVGAQFPILLALFEYGFILYLKKTARKVEDHNQKMDIDDSKPDISDRIKT